MEIVVETTEQDHIDFYRQYGLKRNWQRRLLILLAVDGVLSAIGLFPYFYVINLLVIGIILFPFFFGIPFFRTKTKLKNAHDSLMYPNLQKTYKPFSSGIEITDRTEVAFLTYDDIKEAGKTGNFIFVLLPNADYYLLPTWCFADEDESARFLTIITNGIANAKGIEPKTPLTFKPIYFIGLLCLIPLIGAITGFVLIILGIAHFKDRVFIIMGAIGILITVAVYGSLIYYTQNSSLVADGFADMSQTELNDLVKSVEFYKLQNGAYPDSLQQLETKNSSVSIYDPVQGINGDKKALVFQYQKKGNKYLLFSVGKDGKANTKDDIYPTVTAADTSKLGLIRK